MKKRGFGYAKKCLCVLNMIWDLDESNDEDIKLAFDRHTLDITLSVSLGLPQYVTRTHLNTRKKECCV